MAETAYAIGVLLRLLTPEEGGRRMPLAGGPERFRCRPNWGLPGTEPPEMAGAPVWGFDREQVAPGDTARAVLVPIHTEAWASVDPGAGLPMYEGPRVIGHAQVLWRRTVELPLRAEDEAEIEGWLG